MKGGISHNTCITHIYRECLQILNSESSVFKISFCQKLCLFLLYLKDLGEV